MAQATGIPIHPFGGAPSVYAGSGTESMEAVKQNRAVAKGFKPLTADGMQHLPQRCRLPGADGRFQFFKIMREQHGFPKAAK